MLVGNCETLFLLGSRSILQPPRADTVYRKILVPIIHIYTIGKMASRRRPDLKATLSGQLIQIFLLFCLR
jgi:hypothetical protein